MACMGVNSYVRCMVCMGGRLRHRSEHKCMASRGVFFLLHVIGCMVSDIGVHGWHI